jgi:MarR family transcriptional regulator, organic hydroperoxide resistance regulator
MRRATGTGSPGHRSERARSVRRGSPEREAGAPASLKGRDAAEVVRSLRRLFKAIHEYSKAIFRRTGLSGPQVWALTVLAGEPRLSLSELAERLFAHPSTVSGIVDRLEDRRAVLRSPDPEDRRGIRLSLTPLGRRLLRSSPPPVQVGLRDALEGLPGLQLRQLRRSLDLVVRRTAARRVEAPFFEVEGGRGASRKGQRTAR